MSYDSHIPDDIRALLSEDARLSDIEGIVSSLVYVRPKVISHPNYRQSLRRRLVGSQHTPRIARYVYPYSLFGWVGSICAVLVLVVGFVRILDTSMIVSDISDISPGTAGSYVLGTVMSDGGDTQTDGGAIGDMVLSRAVSENESISYQSPKLTQDTYPPSPQSTEYSLLQSENVNIYPVSTPMTTDMPMMARVSSVESTDTTDMGVMMQDMVWEINAIIQDAATSQTLVLPPYPREMLVYTREFPFSPEERASLSGDGIISVPVMTYSRDSLSAHIRESYGEVLGLSAPTLTYTELSRGSEHILIPALVYRLDSGESLYISLTPEYTLR